LLSNRRDGGARCAASAQLNRPFAAVFTGAAAGLARRGEFGHPASIVNNREEVIQCLIRNRGFRKVLDSPASWRSSLCHKRRVRAFAGPDAKSRNRGGPPAGGPSFLAFDHPPPNLPHEGGGAARWSRHHPATSPTPHPPPCGEGWGGGGRGNGILLSTPAAIISARSPFPRPA